jgi:hypothetical protein
VVDADGDPVGKAVEALIECAAGEVSYVAVATSQKAGIAETLRAVPREHIRFGSERLVLDMPRAAFEALPILADGDWPASPEPHARGAA